MNHVYGSILLLVALVASSAQAATLLIDAQPYNGQRFSEAKYQVDESLGRAWIAVTTVSRPQGAKPIVQVPQTENTQVPGLSFDAANHQIVFTGEKGLVTCASTSEKHGFWGPMLLITPTGLCSTRAAVEIKIVDDGFHGRREKVLNVYFSVQEQ